MIVDYDRTYRTRIGMKQKKMSKARVNNVSGLQCVSYLSDKPNRQQRRMMAKKGNR